MNEPTTSAPPPAPRTRTPDALLGALERLLAIDATSVTGALDQASQGLAAALGADKVDVFLHEPASASLVALGTSPTPMGRRQHQLGLDRLPLANGGREVAVYRTGAPYRTGRADRDPEVVVGFRDALGIRSLLDVPLEVAGARRGVLHAASARPDFFTADDARFLAAVARWVGMVAHRAELVEQAAAAAAERGRQRAAEELVTVLAHDLKNYLVPIRGRLQLLERRARREARPRDLGDLVTTLGAVDRLGRAIADLLDAGRLDQGLFALAPQPLDLAALAQETAAALDGGATPIRVRADAEVVVCADPDRARQALENLIANAVAHSPAGAPVEVTAAVEARAGDPWGVLTVADRGPGIPPAVRPRLFERFGRGPGSAGLGLGLYLARRIAAAHGGTLTADEDDGAGARFRLALPAEGPTEGEGTPAPAATAPA